MNLYDHIGNENIELKTVFFEEGYTSGKVAFLALSSAY